MILNWIALMVGLTVDAAAKDLSSFVGAYPHELLGDEEGRHPLVRIVGEAQFREFRDHIGVAGPMEVLDHRWLVGHGCLPHSCTFNEGYFAIDLRTGSSIVAQFDFDLSGIHKWARIWIWTNLNAADAASYGLRTNIDQWLTPTGAKLVNGTFKVLNPRNLSNDGTPPALFAQPTPSNTPSTTPPGKGKEVSQTRVGPSFDCGTKAVVTQPLAQMICANKELAYWELSYVIAYQALKETATANERKNMVSEANDLVIRLNEQCSIPKTGAIQRGPADQEINCIKSLFQEERRRLLERATGAVREEAQLGPNDTIAIQKALQEQSYLSSGDVIDGVFGPVTRTALSSWQRDHGFRDTGFGSKAVLEQSTALAAQASTAPSGRDAPVPTTAVETRSARRPISDRSGKTSSIRLALSDGPDLRPQDVFEKVSGAVYLVKAQDTLGSAVAISNRELLTNCHVVESGAFVSIEHEGIEQPAIVVSANSDADRCILKIGAGADPLPTWVRVRPYADVKVGERVFSIGAPRGLELSLAEGIVSSKRALDNVRLFQTSAPISRGSSGGGLFDSQGNLLGITTFMLKDSQNLNFAIAAEEYAK
jgi:S1-C subfamily serine protease